LIGVAHLGYNPTKKRKLFLDSILEQDLKSHTFSSVSVISHFFTTASSIPVLQYLGELNILPSTIDIKLLLSSTLP
jgi:hypothetical protein